MKPIYAKKSFAEKNIERFGSKIIGLNSETEFITTGMLQNIQKPDGLVISTFSIENFLHREQRFDFQSLFQ